MDSKARALEPEIVTDRRILVGALCAPYDWLFAGSEMAGKRAAVIQSLIATAKVNGLDPHKWLVDTLTKLPTHLICNIDELLPLARN